MGAAATATGVYRNPGVRVGTRSKHGQSAWTHQPLSQTGAKNSLDALGQRHGILTADRGDRRKILLNNTRRLSFAFFVRTVPSAASAEQDADYSSGGVFVRCNWRSVTKPQETEPQRLEIAAASGKQHIFDDRGHQGIIDLVLQVTLGGS